MKILLSGIFLICFSILLGGCDSPNDPQKIVMAKNGLPSVKSLISKPELKGLLKNKSVSKEDATKLIAALTGYNEKLIEISINLIGDNNDVDFGKFGTNDKTISTEFFDENYSAVVTATAASLLINAHPILEAGDTKTGCVIKAKINANLYSNGGTVTIWIEPKDGKIYVYGKSELNQIYDLFGVNDKGLKNIFDGINQSLGRHQNFQEANSSSSK